MKRLISASSNYWNNNKISADLFSSDSFLVLNKKLLKRYGPERAVFITNLFDKLQYFKSPDGWFYHTHQHQIAETGLIENTIRRFKKELCDDGILETKFKGIPAKEYYRIDINKLIETLDQNGGSEETSPQSVHRTRPKGVHRTVSITTNNNKEETTTKSFLPVLRTEEKSDFVPKSQITSAIKESYKKKQKEVLPPILKGKVLEVFEHWEEMNLYVPAINTKSYRNSVQQIKRLLSGKLFDRKYSENEIITSITNFSIAAFDKDIAPSNPSYKKKLQKMSIGDFIENSFASNGNQSLFLKYLTEELKVSKCAAVENLYPEITEQLKRFYETKALGGVKPKYTDDEENQFRMAIKRLVEFFEKNATNISYVFDNSVERRAEFLCNALEADLNGDFTKLSPGYFCSNMTFNRRLPAYLYAQGIILGNDIEYEGRRFSIYDDNRYQPSDEEEEDYYDYENQED